MRWPWRRPPPATDEAQRHIDHIREQQPEVSRLTRDLAAARERNHFSDMITEAMRGRRAAPDR